MSPSLGRCNLNHLFTLNTLMWTKWELNIDEQQIALLLQELNIQNDLETNSLFQIGFICSGNWSSTGKHTGGDQFSKPAPSAPARRKPSFIALPIPKSAKLPFLKPAFSQLGWVYKLCVCVLLLPVHLVYIFADFLFVLKFVVHFFFTFIFCL